MKITKYPNRYTISLSPAEFDMLKELVGRAKVDFADESQLVTLSPKMRVKLRSHRWALIGGPLTVDVEKSRRGGKPKVRVRCITSNQEFDSIESAAASLGLHRADISQCLAGSRKSTGGFQFEKL